ncbi:MAG TPA: PHP-associated domain-containing protein [Bacteroidales bacterium]|nr:PHP-associated domain-containing protein [Bacteroidales bacterium]
MKLSENITSFKADLHVHTVLSPCGDLEMSPVNIVERALQQGLDILGVADHNSGLQCQVVREVGLERGLTVLCGMEINTREEVHCLAFFPSLDQLEAFGQLIYERLADFPNQPDKFGYQAVVDRNDQILDQPEKLLISAVDMGIEETERSVHEMGGLFIPAHIDRMRNGIIAQLGFIPPDLRCDALEISRHTSRKEILRDHPSLKDYPFIQSSDAHFIEDVGAAFTVFELEKPGLEDIGMALKRQNGRKITSP